MSTDILPTHARVYFYYIKEVSSPQEDHDIAKLNP